MLRWFRRKDERTADPAPAQGATPEAPEHLDAPARARPEQGDDQKPKRRRGSRGGRGRRKPTAAAAAPADAKPKAETEPAPERRAAERKAAPAKPRPRQRRRTPAKRPPLPPAKRELLVSVDVGEQRVAVLEDDKVAEVYLERPERRSIAGNIYKGVVDNVLPGMEAAFVEIGLEKNGFLYVDEIVVPELEGRRHGKKIQDLIGRGEQVLVQAVKDPMKSKGARLTTEISLPGRFVVFVPSGEGLGVSRRLEDSERDRLREILKALNIKRGGVIVRTAAEGASAEDVERDLVFLQRLWKAIEDRAKSAQAPALLYQEAELPLRVVRDLFTEDFERALVDDERTLKRIHGYLKKTSPHMVERVSRHREKTPLMDAYGVDGEIRSTLSRRVDLPSGGYLVFDYAEAFTVIDVNTGRFVGSRSKSSGARLEDTITKNNLEAVKEVVRQLRLRDIGGIIVIDFIDMANPKNRATVEEALKTELERDRTKTYVVEISPLGLVEMTRQNVTDGPREILTRKCPVCAGDGVVVSATTAAIDLERRLRALAAGSRHKAYRVELNAHVASVLIGPGAARLREIEERLKRRFLIEGREDVATDHFEVLAQGTLEKLAPTPALAEGKQVQVKLVEVGRHDLGSGAGTLDGITVCVGEAASLVGKTVKVRLERVFDGTAYATLVGAPAPAEQPITAESQAEKPTRKPAAKRPALARGAKSEPAAEEAAVAEEPGDRDGSVESEEPPEDEQGEPEAPSPASGEQPTPRKRTRRGSRGGRGRRRKPPAEGEPPAAAAGLDGGPKIHLPGPELGRPGSAIETVAEVQPQESAAAANGDESTRPKKKTRRGSRGGRNRSRRKRETATAGAQAAGESTPSE